MTRLGTVALLLALLQPAAQAEEERLGEVSFPISCSPAAQQQFNRGVALLHTFFYPETTKAFTAIAEQEPACAMAYWGVAISQRPIRWRARSPGTCSRRLGGDRQGTRGRAEDRARARLDRALRPSIRTTRRCRRRTRTANYEAAMGGWRRATRTMPKPGSSTRSR